MSMHTRLAPQPINKNMEKNYLLTSMNFYLERLENVQIEQLCSNRWFLASGIACFVDKNPVRGQNFVLPGYVESL